jgi:hypothetical protein
VVVAKIRIITADFSKILERKGETAVYIGMTQNNMLGKDGLTVTSANHVANVAKEMYEAAESRLKTLKLYSRDYMLAVNGNTYRVENESEKAELEALADVLKEIGDLKSLIAFLREGIKAKERLTTDEAFEEYVDGLVREGRTDLAKPATKAEATFEKMFNELTPEQKARYYALEAKCATIGAFIHPDGVFAKERDAYFAHKQDPIQVVGNGQEAEVNTYTSGFTAEEVDEAFFALQKEYRSMQAELNKLKAEVEEKANDAAKETRSEKIATLQLWTEARKAERAKYNEAVKALKVVIPQNLRSVYDKVKEVL